MMFLAVLVSLLLTGLLGAVLVRVLGWPTTLKSASRWGYAMLVVGVLCGALPQLLESLSKQPWGIELPVFSLTEALPALLALGLAALGYVAYSRGAEGREEDARRQQRAAEQQRPRARPPAPGANGTTPYFAPRGERAERVDERPAYLDD